MVTEKGMVGTFWRSGDRIVAKHRLASGRIHSRATIHSGYLLLEQRSRVKGSSRGNECSREKWLTLFGLDLDRSFHRLAYRSDFLKEFTLLRILLGIVKPAPSSICQTVELPFDETFPLYKSPRNGYLGLPTATETARFPSKRLILIESQILGFEILCTTKWFLDFGIMDNCWICSLRKKD